MKLTPVALHARRACHSHAELALALAAEFRLPLPGVGAALDGLAEPLRGGEGDTPADQLACCAEAVAARFEPAALQWSGIDDLLLDRVVAGGSGHPLALAVVCVETARRAGIELAPPRARAPAVAAELGRWPPTVARRCE